jgi:hypothetical protein
LKEKNNILQVLTLISAIFLFLPKTEAQASFDSLKIKLPKHYFKTVILLDSYQKNSKDIKDTSDFINKQLKSYGVRQFIFSLNTPIATIEKPTGDSGITKNTHILLTANYANLQPVFSGIPQHNLVKAGVGLRVIFNSGKKSVWFIDASPFITKDITYKSNPYYRLASTIVYSYNVNDHFNWRIGATKSFLWGNRLYLPFFGLRFGRLDKTNLSIQFPRCINLNIPVGQKLIFSLYTKPQGGMYNFSNHDSLYYIGNDATFHFTRYEINSGLRADVRVNPWFNFYVALGLSTKNNITFYSEKANKDKPRLPYAKYFYNKNMPSTLFLNFGLVFKFGKTKSYFYNRNIYDAIDLNNTIGDGDNNISNGNTQIPNAPKTVKKNVNLSSVQDLIDYNDL